MNEVPPGWAEATLPQLVSRDGIFIDGDWVESKDQDPEGDVRLIQLADVGDGAYRNRSSRFLTLAKAHELRCTFLEPGDILVARMPDPLGRACVFPGDPRTSVTVVDVCIVRPGRIGANPRWLMHAINAPQFRLAMSPFEKGTTRKRISRGNLALISLPVPPLPEQERIVAAIEEQFSRLEAGIAALERVRQNLKRMRAAVLQAAVTGQLVPDQGQHWDNRSLPTLGTLDRGKSRHRPRNAPELYGGPYPFIQTGDVAAATPWIRSFSQSYSDYGLAQSRLWPRGTLCITIAANIARTGLLAFDGCFPDSVVGFVANDGPTAARWVELIVRSMQNDLEQLAPATAQKNINLVVLRALEIPYPHLSYQALVVEEYDRQMSLITSLDVAIDAAVLWSARLRSSILAAAFSGKMAAQDPGEESASALLERIAAERRGSNGRKSTRTRKPRAVREKVVG